MSRKVEATETLDSQNTFVKEIEENNAVPQPIEEVEVGGRQVEDKDSSKRDVPFNAEPALVYATAVLVNSPDNHVTKNYIDKIKIIDSKDHLQRNIEDFKFGNISTWGFGSQNYKHQIQVIIQVKTAYLWESPKGYLWRHLGTSSWTLQDGTDVSLFRIHQK